MGEINPEVAGGRPRLVVRPLKFTPTHDPAILACAPQPGPAVFVNLAPGPSDTFRLLAAPVEVLEDTADEAMKGIVRGWIRPRMAIEDFLEEYSRSGGTHHSALVLGEKTEAIAAMARLAGIEFLRLG
jgi:L-arabinose isomerase